MPFLEAVLHLHQVFKPRIQAIHLALQGTTIRGRILIPIIDEIICYILTVGGRLEEFRITLEMNASLRHILSKSSKLMPCIPLVFAVRSI
jgi:hypothetical protein